MGAPRKQFALHISGHADADVSELAHEVSMLRSELLALDVDAVEAPVIEEAPPGSKGSAAAVAGTLLLTMQQSASLMSAVIGTLRAWVSRDSARRVTIELNGDSIDVARTTLSQQERLIQAWLDHSRS